MKIYGSISKYISRTTFKSCAREYQDENLRGKSYTNGTIRTNTRIFRDDIDWFNFAMFALRNFKEKPQVNTYSLACSDGSEAYTLAMSLMECSNQAQKFFPIKAVDKDAHIIDIAKGRRINLDDEDEFLLFLKTFGNNYFVDRGPAIKINNEKFDTATYSYRASDKLIKAVDFEHGDLVRTLDNISDDGNSLILCRNVMPYLHFDDHSRILKILEEKLKSGSLFVLGRFDYSTKFTTELSLSKHFVETQRSVFRKI